MDGGLAPVHTQKARLLLSNGKYCHVTGDDSLLRCLENLDPRGPGLICRHQDGRTIGIMPAYIAEWECSALPILPQQTPPVPKELDSGPLRPLTLETIWHEVQMLREIHLEPETCVIAPDLEAAARTLNIEYQVDTTLAQGRWFVRSRE